ncbi:transcription initiation factor TFIID component TAF4 family-domain-containing protein [Absidia repens]|uniref:Transcription initiation factor TFIID subunit 4 n=1 Tax=Absidia repens TaxID=90262 RepID=A0A1X2IP56_9FUNG|nr:transcription initiation factor TFIID component TAF4 family-domain-containing protein [Absidia repens]
MSDGEKDKGVSQGHHTQQVDDLYIRNLFDDSTLFTNDNSFQSLVQTIGNEDQNATPAQFNMPTELQHLFDNDSEDVLSTTGHSGVFQPGQGTTDFISIQSLSTSLQQQQQQHNTTQRQYQQSSNHQTIPSPQKIATPAQSSSSSGTMTLLDSITAQLPSERKNKFNLLFVELQKNTITPENFLTQAKYLLDERGYRMLENLLENLKEQTPTTSDTTQGSSSSTSIDITSSTSTVSTSSSTLTSVAANDQRKRLVSSSQIRHEDSQRSMLGLMGTPQSKRSKIDHAPGVPRGLSKAANTHMNIATPPPLPTSSSEPPSLPGSSNVQAIATPEFKQPDAPVAQGVQMPRPSSSSSKQSSNSNIATPSSSFTTIAPTAQPAATSSSATTSGGGGGGDNRIDYDAITDVMGYAGVDLKEEVEHFMKDGGDTVGGIPVDGVDRSKSQDFMNGRLLQQVVTKLAKPLAINHVDPDVVAYLSLATQDRLRGLVADMVKASKHRIERRSPFQRAPPMAVSTSSSTTGSDYPLYKILVKADPKQALMALEQLDRSSSSSPSSSSLSSPTHLQNSKMSSSLLRNHGDKRWKLTSKSYGSAIKTFSVEDTNEEMNEDKNVTVMDAIFALEREGQGGKGSGQKTLLKMYNQWLQ